MTWSSCAHESDGLRPELGIIRGVGKRREHDHVLAAEQILEIRVNGLTLLFVPWRLSGIIPEPMIVAVGVEDRRSLPELLLKTVGVELGLLLAGTRVASAFPAITKAYER